jgi:Spy/CpxP family protein refolding chaperone
MKKFNLLKILSLTAILFGSLVSVFAQPEPPPPNQFVENRPPNLVQALGLTQDQIRQLRQTNATLGPQLKESERNLRQSRQALDEAIYSDESSDELIRERLQNFQNAQAEVARNRTMMEVSIRKILTRDQMFKFRQLRQRAMKKQNAPTDNPKVRPNQPKRPLQNRLGRPIN